MCKPRVVAEMLLTALIGMLVAEPVVATVPVVVCGLLGIGLLAAASATINHIADRRIDARMERTAGRPLAQGRVRVAHSIAFAVLLAAGGTALLAWFTNPLTVALTLATLIGYAFVYTSFLKYATPQNIVIGGLAGAMPPLLGDRRPGRLCACVCADAAGCPWRCPYPRADSRLLAGTRAGLTRTLARRVQRGAST
jgi:protoheme IX farnesyltransferase